jgi:hypothetical protein
MSWSAGVGSSGIIAVAKPPRLRQRGNTITPTLRLLCFGDDAARARYRCDAVGEERRPLTQIKTSFARTCNSLEG